MQLYLFHEIIKLASHLVSPARTWLSSCNLRLFIIRSSSPFHELCVTLKIAQPYHRFRFNSTFHTIECRCFHQRQEEIVKGTKFGKKKISNYFKFILFLKIKINYMAITHASSCISTIVNKQVNRKSDLWSSKPQFLSHTHTSLFV